MSNARHESRIRRLAGVLCMDWLPGTRVEKYDGKWWLVGAAGGDQPLPNTSGCRTLPEALDAAEAWLAPERALVRQQLVPRQEEMAEEHRALVLKRHGGGLDRRENARLAFLKWQLDRVDDALAGDHLDRLEGLAAMHGRLANFVDDFTAEWASARRKFPSNRGLYRALGEEVGELAKALSDESYDRVWAEAVQVAAMAARCAIELDAEAADMNDMLATSVCRCGRPGIIGPCPSPSGDDSPCARRCCSECRAHCAADV